MDETTTGQQEPRLFSCDHVSLVPRRKAVA